MVFTAYRWKLLLRRQVYKALIFEDLSCWLLLHQHQGQEAHPFLSNDNQSSVMTYQRSLICKWWHSSTQVHLGYQLTHLGRGKLSCGLFSTELACVHLYTDVFLFDIWCLGIQPTRGGAILSQTSLGYRWKVAEKARVAVQLVTSHHGFCFSPCFQVSALAFLSEELYNLEVK